MPDVRPRSFAVLTVLLFATIATAQHDTAWVRRLSGTGNGDDRVAALATDPAGNVHAAILNSPSDTTTATITVKYSPDGELLWSRRFVKPGDVTPEDIAVGHDGSVFVVGTHYDGHGDDVVLLKYTGSGDSCWVRYYDGTGFDDIAAAVLADESGNVYVAGTSETDDYEDMLLVKYSSSGEELWVRLYDYQHEEDFGLALVLDRQGYIYEAGAVMNSQGSGDLDLAILKYSPAGALVWARAFSGPGMNEDDAVVLAVDPQNNLVVACCSHPNSDSSGFLVVKYSPSGDTLWSRCVIGDRDDNGAVGIGADSLGNVVVAGNLDRAYLVVKYSPAGTELWRQTYNGPRTWDSLAAVVVEPGGNVCVTGWAGRNSSEDDAVTVMFSPAGDSLWAQRWVVQDSLSSGGLALVKAGDRYYVGGTYEREYHDDANLICYDRSGAYQWDGSVNGPGTRGAGSAEDVACDRDGNFLLAGWVENMDAYKDMAVAKFNPDGDLLWLETWGGVPYGENVATEVAVDSTGFVCVTGYSETEDTGFDFVTARYDPNGNLIWRHSYNGPADGDDLPVALAVDAVGNVAVTGESPGVGTALDFATVRYSAAGQESWTARYNGASDSTDDVGAVAVDDEGATYVSGRSREQAGIQTGTVVKYDGFGTPVWTAHVEDPDTGRTRFKPIGIGLGPSGAGTIGGYGGLGFIAVKLDSSGDTIWTARASFTRGCKAFAAAVDEQGRTYIVGELDDDYITVCFSSSGVELWRRTFDLGRDEAYDVAVGPGGTVAVTGRADRSFNATVLYDSLGNELWADSLGPGGGAGSGVAFDNAGRIAVALTRWSLAVAVYEPRIGIAEPKFASNRPSPVVLCARPNPFTRTIGLTGTARVPGDVRIDIFDRTGRQVRRFRPASGADGYFTFTWDGTDAAGRAMPSGVYFIRAECSPGGGIQPGWRPSESVKVVKTGR